jgi:DNA-binding NtrC family response regulator
MAETETFDVNARVALIVVDDSDRKGEVSAALQEVGYRVHIAASADDGRDRLRKAMYHVVVIDQGFQGGTALDNPLLQLLQGMPMTTRRYMLLVMLAPDVKTLDNMTAFAASVNAVVNYNDVAQFKAVLERALADNDQFFRVIRSVLQEAGKH